VSGPSLEPIELNGSIGTRKPPPGPGPRGGAWWPETWRTTTRRAREFAAGWPSGEFCIPDPKDDARPGRQAWRAAGLTEANKAHKQAHANRARVVRAMRSAGYTARRLGREVLVDDEGAVVPRRAGYDPETGGPYLLPDWRYTEGPAAGLPAVDPWKLGLQLAGCGAVWDSALRSTSIGIAPLPTPNLCGKSHVCPVCANIRSSSYARAVRACMEDDGGAERAVLVTLTQRARRGERLASALGRLVDAWRRLVRGRSGTRWRRDVAAWFKGIEVTRGAGASSRKRGRHWHPHIHVVVLLEETADLPAFRTWLGQRWERASGAAAREAGRPGAGWDPAAGGVARQDWTFSGDWFQDLPDDRAVRQACKYPSPISQLHPDLIPEFLANAAGRRWHEGGGRWRGVLRRAAALEEADEAEEDTVADVIGENICGRAPGECPDVDEIDPGLGLPEDDERAARGALVHWPRWRLTLRGCELIPELEAEGLRVEVDDEGRTWASAPRDWARRRQRALLAALAALKAPGD
jgi:hypothetical protein